MEAKKYKEEPADEEYNPNICNRIKTCVYGGKMGAEHICDYLMKTGCRRPCLAGECVMYKRKERRK